MTPSPTISVYGLGIIGTRVLARLRQQGFTACGWNRNPRPELDGVSQDLAATARDADIHQVFVRDGPAVLAVIDGLLPHLRPGRTVVVHATISPEEMKEAARRVEAAGAAFLEAPFTGSREASAAGNLVYFTGDDADVLESIRPVLAASSKAIVPCGRVGDASVLKIATNMVTVSIVQALAEGLAVVKAAGLDPASFRPAVENNACRSGTSDMKLATMIAGEFAPHFSLKNMLKDARLGLALAAAAGVELPALGRTAAVMERLAADPAQADQDFSLLARQFELA